MGNVNMKACLLEQGVMREITCAFDQRKKLGISFRLCWESDDQY